MKENASDITATFEVKLTTHQMTKITYSRNRTLYREKLEPCKKKSRTFCPDFPPHTITNTQISWSHLSFCNIQV